MWNDRSIGQRLTVMNMVTLTVMSALMMTALFYSVHRLLSFEAYRETSGLDASSAVNENIQAFLKDARTSFYVIAGILILLFASLAVFTFRVMTKKALKPLNELTATMDTLDPDNLPKSIRVSNDSREVRKLEHAFNRLLNKVNTTLESQRRFAQNAAHELKTPLSAVMTNIEVLDMDDDPSKDEVLEVLNLTREHMESMHTLVKELLEMHVSTIDKTHFHLHDMALKDESMNDLANSKHMTIELKGDTRLHGSKPLLERAFKNLIHNALRYGHEGGHVVIRAFENALRIEDDGPGINKEHLNKIFDPFYRVEASRSKEYGGNGLGLSIVKEILDRHQMTITVDSSENQGTTFTIKW